MELPYDGDTNDPRQYCPHGTFIGSWWGPDYLCGWCESGEDPPTQFELDQRAFARRLEAARKDMELFDKLTAELNNREGYFANLAQALVDTLDTAEFWEGAIWYYRRQEVFA